MTSDCSVVSIIVVKSVNWFTVVSSIISISATVVNVEPSFSALVVVNSSVVSSFKDVISV